MFRSRLDTTAESEVPIRVGWMGQNDTHIGKVYPIRDERTSSSNLVPEEGFWFRDFPKVAPSEI